MSASIDSMTHPTTFTPDSRAAWVRLIIALVIGSLGSVGMWSVVVVMPTVQADFAATRGDASLAFTCAMLGFGSGGVAMGKLSDRFGIVPAIALGIAMLAAGYLGAAAASALWQFNIMHFAIGLGAAATFGPPLHPRTRRTSPRQAISSFMDFSPLPDRLELSRSRGERAACAAGRGAEDCGEMTEADSSASGLEGS